MEEQRHLFNDHYITTNKCIRKHCKKEANNI